MWDLLSLGLWLVSEPDLQLLSWSVLQPPAELLCCSLQEHAFHVGLKNVFSGLGKQGAS